MLPPNRLRLFNPIQALQALVTRQFGRDGWSARIARIEALLPGTAIRRDFQRFVHALLPRVLESGRHTDAQAMRWALEDAWRDPLRAALLVALRAASLTAAQAEQIVLRVSAALGTQWAQAFTLDQADRRLGAGTRRPRAPAPPGPRVPARPTASPTLRALPEQRALSL